MLLTCGVEFYDAPEARSDAARSGHAFGVVRTCRASGDVFFSIIVQYRMYIYFSRGLSRNFPHHRGGRQDTGVVVQQHGGLFGAKAIGQYDMGHCFCADTDFNRIKTHYVNANQMH